MAKKNHSDFIDFRELFRTYLSKWYYFAISLLIFGAIGYIYARSRNPIYGVRANVLIKQDNNNLMSNFGSLGELFGSSASVDDEIFVISSHSIYRNVARDLGINKLHIVKPALFKTKLAYPKFPVDVTADASIIDTLSTTIEFRADVNEEGLADIKIKADRNVIGKASDVKLPAVMKTSYGDFTVSKTEDYPEGEDCETIIYLSGYDATAEDMSEEIANDIASRKSNVIELGINTENAKYGADILNNVIEHYNRHGINEANEQFEKTLSFINERLALLVDDLNAQEEKIQRYKENNGIIAVEVEAQYQTEKRGKLEEALLNAQTQADVIKMTLDFVNKPGNEYSLIPLAIDNDGLKAAIEGYNEVVLKRLDLVDHAKPNSVALKQLEAQIDAMRENIRSSFSTAYKNAEVTVRDLEAEKRGNDSRLGSIPTQEREYIDLRRQQEIKQQLYLFLLQRQEETSIMLANTVAKGVVVDEAFTLSKPLSTSKILILLVFLMVGALVPPIVIWLQKVIRNKFDTRAEVAKIISAPILGEMCADRSGKNLVVTTRERSSAAELFRLIRSNLLFMLNNENDKVVLMTSSVSGEGKSFISINLAASLAMLGKKVLLVGMDIRKPRLAEYLGINPKTGLTQYLSSSNIEIEDIIYPYDEVPGLDIIAAGPVPPNPAELLSSEKVDMLFSRLRTLYDYIIVDSAPVGMVSDTFTLARISDATVYICRANYTSITNLKELEDIYQDKRLRKLSVVVNGTTSKKVYGYGYGQDNKKE